jgi:hypothetical protein
MKLLLLLLLTVAAKSQQPTFIVVGKMTCAARVNATAQLQMWCNVGTEVRFNCVFPAPINIPNTKGTGYVITYNDPADSSNGEKYAAIVWSFFASLTQPGKVDWQVAYTNDTVIGKLMSGTLQ